MLNHRAHVSAQQHVVSHFSSEIIFLDYAVSAEPLLIAALLVGVGYNILK